MKVLQGLRVVEQGTFITGPAAGMLLGDLGADVVKVEQPLTASAEHRVMGLVRTLRSPLSFDGERALDLRPPPMLGEHGDEIRAALKLPVAGASR